MWGCEYMMFIHTSDFVLHEFENLREAEALGLQSLEKQLQLRRHFAKVHGTAGYDAYTTPKNKISNILISCKEMHVAAMN